MFSYDMYMTLYHVYGNFAGFCANKATMVFMEYNSGEILHLEIGDSRDVERKSTQLEGFLADRGLEYLQNTAGLKIKEVTTDASRTFINLFGKFFIY